MVEGHQFSPDTFHEYSTTPWDMDESQEKRITSIGACTVCLRINIYYYSVLLLQGGEPPHSSLQWLYGCHNPLNRSTAIYWKFYISAVQVI